MPSFQISITPKRRAAARFVGEVRRTLNRALADARGTGATQSSVARALGIHRSAVNRELRGTKDISIGRIGEFAWALGLEPHIELRRPGTVDGENVELAPAPAREDEDINAKLAALAA